MNSRSWAVVALGVVCSIIAIVAFDGRTALAWAAVLGFFVALALVLWFAAGDVRSLRWIWGAVGEEATAEVLEALDGSWAYEHDLPHDHGNWDHVVAGPGGVFLLESKNLSARVRVRGDALTSGRLRFSGGGVRRSAVVLKRELERRLERAPWVQAVFVIWGEFPERRAEENRVAYVRGDELVPWLLSQPERLSGRRLEAVVVAVRALREDSRELAGAVS